MNLLEQCSQLIEPYEPTRTLCSQLIEPYEPTRTLRSQLIEPYEPTRTLRSQHAGLLVVPSISKSRTGGRAFSSQVPLLWNHLPDWFRGAEPSLRLRVGFKRSFVIKLLVGAGSSS